MPGQHDRDASRLGDSIDFGFFFLNALTEERSFGKSGSIRKHIDLKLALVRVELPLRQRGLI